GRHRWRSKPRARGGRGLLRPRTRGDHPRGPGDHSSRIGDAWWHRYRIRAPAPGLVGPASRRGGTGLRTRRRPRLASRPADRRGRRDARVAHPASRRRGRMTDRGGELLRSGRPWLVPAIGCVVLLIASFILAVLLGGSELTPRQALEALFGGRGDGTIPHDRIEARRVAIVSVRVPRVVLAALLGASLAPAGAAYQGLFRNPLADPYIVGVASGAGLGATIVIAVAGSFAAATIYAVPLGGFVGGAAAVGCVILIARARGTTSTATLLLAGVAVGALASALTTFIMMSSPDGVRRVFQWLHGGYTAGGWQPILIVVPYALLGLVGLLACAHPLNVLQLD